MTNETPPAAPGIAPQAPASGSKMKTLAIVALLLIVGAVAAGYAILRGEGISISLSQADIQKQIDKVFPISKSQLIVITLTLSDPKVSLPEGGNRILLDIKADVSLPISKPKSIDGRVTVSTALRYEAADFTFYMKDPNIEKVEFRGMPVKYVDKVNSLVKELLYDRLPGIAVYKLKDGDIKQSAAKIVLRECTVRGGMLVIKLGL